MGLRILAFSFAGAAGYKHPHPEVVRWLCITVLITIGLILFIDRMSKWLGR